MNNVLFNQIYQSGKKLGIPQEVWYPIIMTESGGDPSAVGDNGKSHGLFQINSSVHSDYNVARGKVSIQYQIDYWLPVLAKHYKEGLEEGYRGLDLVFYTERYGEQPSYGDGKFNLTSNVIKNLTYYYDKITGSSIESIDFPLEINGTSIKITSPFGSNRGDHLHQGVDIGAPHGTPIKTVLGGTVTTLKSLTYDYGKYIIVTSSSGYSELFGHMSSFNVKTGQKIKAGDVIGFVGSTGNSTGNHLHYEIRDISGNKINPVEFLESLSVQDGAIQTFDGSNLMQLVFMILIGVLGIITFGKAFNFDVVKESMKVVKNVR